MEIRVGDTFVEGTTKADANGCHHCVYLNGLSMDSASLGYFVRVTAVNAMGSSATSNAIQTQPAQLPGPLSVGLSVVSSDSLMVTYSPPSSDGGNTIKSALIELDTSETFSTASQYPIGAEVLSQSPPYESVIGTLTPGATYYARVAFVNDVPSQLTEEALALTLVTIQIGETSSPSSVLLENQPPLAPKALDVEVLDATVLRLKIEAPIRDGGVGITKYRIEWDTTSTFDSDAAKPLCSVDASIWLESQIVYVFSEVYFYDIGAYSETHALTGTACPSLVAGEPYYFRVKAFNGVGVDGFGPLITEACAQVAGTANRKLLPQ